MVDWARLPGISESGGMQNYAVGIGYGFLVLIVIGAVAGDPDEGEPADGMEDPTPTDEVKAATDTPVATDGGTTAADMATSSPTPTKPSTLQSIRDVDGYYDTTSTTVSASGQTVTDSFDHPGGLLVVDYEHEGRSNFIVEIWDEEADERVAIPINKIGSVDGATGLSLGPGEYSLDVDADGAWSIGLANPIAPREEIRAPPASVNGDGPDVVGPVEFDGSFTATGSHSGDGNFIVWVYDEADGGQFSGTSLFNEIGEVDDAQTRESHTGVAWVVVEANGEWDIEFE